MTLPVAITNTNRFLAALERAKTPEQALEFEAVSAASMAWSKEQKNYELFIKSWYAYVLSRRKTTELLLPHAPQHGGDRKSQQFKNQEDTHVHLIEGFSTRQWNRRVKELEIPLATINAYYDEIIENFDWHPSLAGLMRYATSTAPEIVQERREREIERLAQEAGRYPCILAAPDWTLGKLDQLIPPATTDAVLFLLADSDHLPEALDLMHAWGFAYATSMVMERRKPRSDNYTRQQHDLVLIGAKGAGLELPIVKPSSMLANTEELHSAIERMFPDYETYEMFKEAA